MVEWSSPTPQSAFDGEVEDTPRNFNPLTTLALALDHIKHYYQNTLNGCLQSGIGYLNERNAERKLGKKL